ncbi:ATP-binding cassette domain-containing protein [Egibacter rhizosphaerae]|uniref:ATP-binding cassette domain-containing protein n=1 Tax=Egibacter rhizosphaerae TaxID=1670831 RepID=UPI00197AA8EA|nr:ABC transporter ATP-binding protein [Egibacter rhizosphaerae]
MTHAIEFDEVTQRFRRITALDGLTLRMAGGRIHGLLGRNGSGKSTLLAIAAGFRRPSRGEARIGGQPVFENGWAMTQVACIRGPGDTIEHDWPDDRVRHALDFASGTRPHWDGDYADELLERFGVDRRKRLGSLSRGQRAAVGLVLGLAARAPVTLFDETHLGMDAVGRQTFYETLVADVARHPRTVVLSTHLVDEAAPLCDEVTILDEGRVLVNDRADALRARGAVVTGTAERVDRFCVGHRVLAERTLGRTKATSILGGIRDEERARAYAHGLDLEPIGLQDLFVHLSGSGAASATGETTTAGQDRATGQYSATGETTTAAETADTADTEDTAETADTEDTAETADTADTAETADPEETAEVEVRRTAPADRVADPR